MGIGHYNDKRNVSSGGVFCILFAAVGKKCAVGDTDRPALPAYTAKLPDNARAGTPACCAGVPVSGASKSISRVLS